MMDDKFLKMLSGKKKKRELSDEERNAKLNVMKDMRDMAAGAMGDKIKKLKKVTVASDSEEGIKEGLDKAKEIVGNADPKGEGESEDQECSCGSPSCEECSEEVEESEDSDASPQDEEEMSEDEINKRLEELMKLKEKLKSK